VLLAGLAALAPQRGQAQDSLQVWIENKYLVVLQLSIGNAVRGGADTLSGTLVLQADGTWQGQVTAKQTFIQEMNAFGINVCPSTGYTGTQELTLTGTVVGSFNPKLQSITLRTGAPDGGFLSLSVRTDSLARMSSVDCLTLREDVAGNFPLLPLNDARWTEPMTTYIIGLPQRGKLEYRDITTLLSLPGAAAPIQGPVTSSSVWTVRIERR
jgi:hypothetical protein